ncbi:class II aldolase/adducin family protein [Candidatus Omnitrophota bacterium]
MKKNSQLLTQYSHKIAQKHLVMGAMGNISVRDRGEVWIKKGGAWMERSKSSDFIKVRPKNRGLVSKEINLHMSCYKARPDINTVIHTHPFIITGLGTVLAKMGRKKIDNVTIIKYYKPGSIALARAVKKAIKKTDSVVMANHGLVVVGKSLKEAYQRTVKIEVNTSNLLGRLLS